MEISITAFSAGRDDDIFVNFELKEGENRYRERFLISLSAYTRLSLSIGLSSQDVFDAVEHEARIYAAYRMALRTSCAGIQSNKSLVRRLVAKGCDAKFACLAVERLVENGLHNEQASALRDAEKCLNKLWGRARIRAYLVNKGYGAKEINQTFYAFEDEGVDFVKNCRALIEKRYAPFPKDKNEAQKIIAALVRYGYSVSEIKEAIG